MELERGGVGCLRSQITADVTPCHREPIYGDRMVGTRLADLGYGHPGQRGAFGQGPAAVYGTAASRLKRKSPAVAAAKKKGALADPLLAPNAALRQLGFC